MELTKKGKKVTLKSDVQIAAYKKAGWVEVKGKTPKPNRMTRPLIPPKNDNHQNHRSKGADRKLPAATASGKR